MLRRHLLRSVSALLVVAHLGVFTVPTAMAGLVGADATLEARTTSATAHHTRLREALAREEVREHLIRHGVTPEMAAERIGALSAAEAAQLAADFDNLPAGASFSGLLLVLFFGWALLEIIDYGQIFAGDEKPAATQ